MKRSLGAVYGERAPPMEGILGHETTIVDRSDPAAIATAIKSVNSDPGRRIKPGIEALWDILKSPKHTVKRSVLEQKYGALDLHFGWFCRRVAEELGANEPDVFALVDYSLNDEGEQLLTLKPSVVAAMPKGKWNP